MDLCEKCKYSDGDCEIKGTGPCCGACGCNLKFKVRSLSSSCGLTNINKTPKWLPVMTQDQEDEHFSEIYED
jgi:hypothetical protein